MPFNVGLPGRCVPPQWANFVATMYAASRDPVVRGAPAEDGFSRRAWHFWVTGEDGGVQAACRAVLPGVLPMHEHSPWTRDLRIPPDSVELSRVTATRSTALLDLAQEARQRLNMHGHYVAVIYSVPAVARILGRRLRVRLICRGPAEDPRNVYEVS